MPVAVHLAMNDSTFGLCRLDLEGEVVEVDFSDTTDAVGDLIRAVAHVAAGGYYASARFDREPGQWVLEFARLSDPATWPTVFEVSVFDGTQTAAGLMFRARCDADEFAHATLAEAERLTTAYAAPEYDHLFNQPQPLRAIAALRAALATTDPEKVPSEMVGDPIVISCDSPFGRALADREKWMEDQREAQRASVGQSKT